MNEESTLLDLLDYRRRVSELYAAVRAENQPEAAQRHWRQVRDDLFGNHTQSALDFAQKARFTGLRYYDYDPAFRVTAVVNVDVPHDEITVELDDDGLLRYQRVGRVSFRLPTGDGALSLFWILGYGGGIFLPFADTTNKHETYGAGRYLYDTIKGADLGSSGGEMVLDFNFAYQPSCAYNPRWVCPLAPAENRLDFLIPVGEKLLEL